MGNCLRRESSMQWGGDDWGSPVPADEFYTSNTRQEKAAINIEEKEILGNYDKGLTSSTTTTTTTSSTELKIKITKKQLEELLLRVNMKELSLEQVLAQLMNVTDRSFETHQRSWKPNLQSIPE